MSNQAGRVTYADGSTPVLPGDRVSVRLFFRRRAGEVIHVPGLSPRRATYEHSGLRWVGVSLPDGWAIGEIVLPDTGRLKKSVRFLGRGEESPASIDASRHLDDQERQEAAAAAADTAFAPTSRKPKPVEWVAGGVSLSLHLALTLLVVVAIAGAVALLVRWLRSML